MGAQKNFATFARRIGQTWKKAPDSFNEDWYREAVAKAIVFKATERLVSNQPWYQGGYRANIVAYAIAKTAHDVKRRACSVDFRRVWRRQSIEPSMEEALVTAAEAVHDVLINPPRGISNVTEWAKKQPCWADVQDLDVAWPQAFLDGLISADERRDLEKHAKRDQRELNGMQAQIAVVQAGPDLWADALAWGTQKKLLSPTDMGVLRVAAGRTGRTPTDKQSLRAIAALRRLQSEGFSLDLPSQP